MQVEYEPESQSLPHAGDTSVRADVDGDAGEDDDDRDEREEQAETEEQDAPQKKKRVIKSRQSLAEKPMGTTMFPIARVKRIIKADAELDTMSSEATFLIGVATEYFVKHFMEEGYTRARLDKRRIVNYKDMATVVQRSEEFDFLKDVIPMPMTMSEALEKRKAALAAADEEEEDEDEDDHVAPAQAHAQSQAPAERSSGSGSGRARSSSGGGTGAGTTGEDRPDNMPALEPSTNQAFPNPVDKRPSNTHSRTAAPKTDVPRSPPAPKEPRVLTGKNAPSTSTPLTTRSSARRSMNNNAPARDRRVSAGSVDEHAIADEDDGDVRMGDGDEGDDSMQVDE